MDELVRRHGEIMDKYDPAKRISLVVDEWGCWHQVEPGTNPGFLYQQNSVRDALVAGIHLNIFNNHSDRVRIANIAQAVNVLQSPVLTEGDKMVLTPTWYIFHMYKDHMGATLLGSTAACSAAGFESEDEKIKIPSLNVSASEKKDEKTGKNRYLVTVCNSDLNDTKTLDISLANLKGSISKAEGKLLSGEEMNTCNTFEKPDQVTEKALKVTITDKDTVSITLPARSVAAVTIWE